MNATLRHTHTAHHAALDINKTLKSITLYTWIAAGVLFVGYVYFVGAITFSVVEEKELQQDTRALISSMGTEELEFLSAQKVLTESYAREKGFVEPASVSFAPSQRAFAWNVGR